MDKIGDESLKRILQRELNEKKENLKEVQDWQPSYLKRYADRDKSELLVISGYHFLIF